MIFRLGVTVGVWQGSLLGCGRGYCWGVWQGSPLGSGRGRCWGLAGVPAGVLQGSLLGSGRGATGVCLSISPDHPFCTEVVVGHNDIKTTAPYTRWKSISNPMSNIILQHMLYSSPLLQTKQISK